MSAYPWYPLENGHWRFNDHGWGDRSYRKWHGPPDRFLLRSFCASLCWLGLAVWIDYMSDSVSNGDHTVARETFLSEFMVFKWDTDAAGW
jgi:hypothetical protein